MLNPYAPYPVRIEEVIDAVEDKSLKTFKFVFQDPDDEEKFSYRAGQFAELSVTGQGEIPIGIASSPTEKGYVMFTVFRTGKVTSYLHNMQAGDIMGIRGPLGNWYPWDTLEGKNIVIIGGGFAFTTLRSSIVYMLDPANRSKFKDIHVIYGARTPGLLLYRDELMEWEKRDDINMHITVDGTDDPDWAYNIGFVPTITEQKAPQADDDTYAILYTSGTTGRPKGAMIPHRQVLWNCINTVTSWGLTEYDVSPVFTPMFHAGGLFAFLTPLFYVGGRIVLFGSFDLQVGNAYRYN